MRRFAARVCLIFFGIVAAVSWNSPVGAAEAPQESGRCSITKQENVPATMRDGTILRADVYTPDSPTPVPVILMRTQYGKKSAQVHPSRFQPPEWYAEHCYIVVIQDVRGQYASDGRFYEYVNERQDGYDSVEWAARLPGSNGKVGMYGSSYVGATQWLAATGSPPSLKAIAPSNTGSDYYDGWTYENGAFRVGFVQPWMMSLAVTAAEQRKDYKLAREIELQEKDSARWMLQHPFSAFPVLKPSDPLVAPWYFDTIKHFTKDAYWNAVQIEGRYDKVTVPVLAFDGWYDSFLGGAIKNFEGMRAQGANPVARQNQRLVVGPWEHVGWGRPDSEQSPRLRALSPVADSPVNELTIAFFDRFLKGRDNGFDGGPRIDYFMMGENKWHSTQVWPPPGTAYKNLYLASAGHAASLRGDGVLVDAIPQHEPRAIAGRVASDERVAVPHAESGDATSGTASADSFIYDPANPVPSAGGHSCCEWATAAVGQFDQSTLEQRADILVYTGERLRAPLVVTGPVSVKLYAQSTAVDTDFTAKLIDVFPDGTAINLSNGIQRASFRESLTTPELIIPNKVYVYSIKLWPTSNLFQAGHRIRLEISSSDYPQFAPNPNTGESFGSSSQWKTASQTILHDADHPSALILSLAPLAAVHAGTDRFPLR